MLAVLETCCASSSCKEWFGALCTSAVVARDGWGLAVLAAIAREGWEHDVLVVVARDSGVSAVLAAVLAVVARER